MKHGLVFAMESEEAVVDAAVVPETQAEVEVAATEVTEQVAEIETMDTAIDSAETDAGTLGDIQEVMTASVDSGEGLTEEAAQIAEVAVEAIRARLGMKRDQKVMPSMESFGSKSSRLTATKVAIEGIKETMKGIWESIVKAVKWVWNKIKSFFMSLTKHRATLLKHLTGLQDKVRAFSGDAAKTVTGTAVKAFNVGGKTDAGTAMKVLGDSAKMFKGVAVGATSAAGLVNKLTDVKGTPADLTESGLKLLEAIQGPMTELGSVTSEKKGADGKSVAHYGNLAFGRSIVISTDSDAVSNSGLVIQLEDNSKEAAKDAPGLSKAEMEKVLAASIDLVKSLQAYDKIEKDLEKITKACEQVSTAVINGVSNMSEDKEVQAGLQKAAKNIRSLNAMVAKFGSSMPSAVYQAAKAGGDYVYASMSGKKEEKKEEKKD
jgi:hypothetical protein